MSDTVLTWAGLQLTAVAVTGLLPWRACEPSPFGPAAASHLGLGVVLKLYVACAAVFFTQVHDGTTTPLNQFMKDPDSLITRVTWKDEQDKVSTDRQTDR